MLAQITLGILLLIVATAVHATAMSFLLWRLRATHAAAWALRSYVTRLWIVSSTVLCLVLASLVEVGIWTATYLAVGALSEPEPALYFSMVTYTTLGYGDIVLPPSSWRLLASFEAANGILMFGWTTAVIFFVVQRLYLTDRD
jgi:hypothetical protein